MPSEIRRGDIYKVNWDPARGSEQKGIRPALVIQNDIGNEFGATVIVATVSTRFTRKIYPFQVLTKSRESGLPQDSIIDLGQLITIDKARLVEKCGRLDDLKMIEIGKAIKLSLGL